MKHVILKLNTGEEVIGKTDSNLELDESINLEDAMNIVYRPDDNGNYIIKLIDFMTCSEERIFTFNKKYVILYCIPSKNVIDYYKSVVSFDGIKIDDKPKENVIDMQTLVNQKITIH